MLIVESISIGAVLSIPVLTALYLGLVMLSICLIVGSFNHSTFNFERLEAQVFDCDLSSIHRQYKVWAIRELAKEELTWKFIQVGA